MRIYQVTAIDHGEGAVNRWAESKRMALKERAQMRRDYNILELPTITAVDFPTTRAGIVAWLNVHLTHEV